VAIDSAIQRRRTALPRLLDRMHTMQGKGHHGCVLLRELLLDSGGESLLERRFLALMRRSRLPRPRCQATMPSAPGRRMRVDFLFGRVVVEVSGRLGHVTETDRRRDLERRNALQGQGFTVVEFTTVHVIDAPDYVVSTLRTAFSVTST
jgi:very-short-patch-repair endonuclease